MLACLRNKAKTGWMTHPLERPVYRRLFAAQVVSLVGTGLATVALSLVAFDLASGSGGSGSSAGQILGTAFAIKMVAYVTVAPLASAALTRLPARSVLVAADAVRAGAAIMLPFVDQVWQVYLLVALLQAASATFTPTFQAVVPRVLTDRGEYTAALSLARMAEDLETVLSPVLAGGLLLVVAAPTLFVGTAAGFVASALLVLSVVLPPPLRSLAPDAPRTARGARTSRGAESFGQRLRGGGVLLLGSAPLRGALLLGLAVAAAGALVLVQTVAIVREVFGLGAWALPVALAANGLGSIMAAAALPRVLAARSERTVMLAGASLTVAATALVPAVLTVRGEAGLVLLCAVWAMVGAGWAAAETPVGRLIQAEIAPRDLPAAFAAQFSLSHVCWLMTYPLAGWLAVTTAPWALAALGLVTVCGAAALWPGGPPTRPAQPRQLPASAGVDAAPGGALGADAAGRAARGVDPDSVTAWLR